MFDWEDLRHFAALARQNSLSAAARELDVDHATVARRIAALEASLALKLVDRRPRSYALTAEGERIAALAIRMEDGAFAIERAARAGQPGLAGNVSISAPPTVGSTLIAPRLAQLHARHPGIHIRLIGEKRSASLSRREADIAVRLSRPSEPSLVARKIGSFALALYASPEYLATHSPETFVFIAYDEASEEMPQQQWLKAIAATRPIVLRTNDLEGQQAAARAGLGLACLPRFVGDRDTGLARVEVAATPVTRDIWLVVHGDLRHAPIVRAVLEFLAECLAAKDLGLTPASPSEVR